jgi:hypothetical protein
MKYGKFEIEGSVLITIIGVIGLVVMFVFFAENI